MSLLILIADDDPGIRLFISEYLELSGYSVISAENGEEAISLLETHHPDLLVSDIKMPRKNGYELVRQVRQLPDFRWLPVIFLTERNATSERILGYQAGCDVYLPKPFEMQELGAVITNLLDRIESMKLTLEESDEEKNHKFETVELTKRETEVLQLVTKGLSNVAIGKTLHLSPRTIEKYVSSLLRKTETSNRTELVTFALENNLLD